MTRISRVWTVARGLVNICRHHFYKIIICIVFLLLAAQYGLNVFFYQTSNYFSFNVSSWTSLYSNDISNKVTAVLVTRGADNNLNYVTDRVTKEILRNFSSQNYASTSAAGGIVTSTRRNNNVTITNNGVTALPIQLETFHHSNISEQVIPQHALVSSSITVTSTEMPALMQCPSVPPKLVGPVKVWTNAPSFEELEKMYPELELGGRFRPKECISRHKVAIIIPYRDREEHLRIFLHNIHPILQRQQVDYGIYVIEQKAKTKFNRAKLMNVGYAESLKQYDYQCFIFHDVDLLPEDDRNLYWCPEQPRHMSVAIDTFRYRLPYDRLFGGVSALNKSQMEKINGFSNQFWGWGGEDDDMANRILHYGYHISRYPANIARYKMLKHKKDDPNPERYKMLYKGKQRYRTDGINSLRYQRLDILLKRLYTWVLVDLLEKN